ALVAQIADDLEPAVDLFASPGYRLDEPLRPLPALEPAEENDLERSIRGSGLDGRIRRPTRPDLGNDTVLHHAKDPAADPRGQARFGSLVGYDQALGVTLRVDRPWQGFRHRAGEVLHRVHAAGLQEAKARGIFHPAVHRSNDQSGGQVDEQTRDPGRDG